MTSAAGSDLVAAIFDGLAESPPWTGFLDQLRRLSGADHAVLGVPPRGGDLARMVSIIVSASGVEQRDRPDPAHLFPPDRDSPLPASPEGVAWSLDELFGKVSTGRNLFYQTMLEREGVSAGLQMAVREKSGMVATLTLTRAGAPFTPEDRKRLQDIAPVLRGAFQVYVASERERFAASVNAETIRRLQFGWLVLDADGRLIDCDDQGRRLLESGILGLRHNGVLSVRPAGLERQIFEALAQVTGTPQGRPRAVILSRDPWVDMLLVPARSKSISDRMDRTAIAYVHADTWRSTDRRDQLADLFGLSPREARLALAISRGLTLSEAAAEFGLTVGTVRAYSKLIYAKTGARGLPDLVRIVMSSVLTMGPDGDRAWSGSGSGAERQTSPNSDPGALR